MNNLKGKREGERENRKNIRRKKDRAEVWSETINDEEKVREECKKTSGRREKVEGNAS